MATYHVGAGIAGIYTGTLNKKGNMWINKSDVTDEAMGAVAQHLLFNGGEFHFNYHGEWYRLCVEKLDKESR